jgi:glyoxylase-like metal-dependent hydrolase (beta-lactamase superfamily II)
VLKVKIFPLGVLSTNCYLVYSDKEAVAIDPGGEASEVLNFLEQNNLTLTHIFNTHLHFDHIQGNASLSKATGVTIWASEKDKYLLESELGLGGFMDFPETPEFSFQNLEPGPLQVLDTTCEVLSTPGHSPGSLSFYFPAIKAVFVGDLIFFRSIGRTDFPGGDQEVLIKSAREKILTLPSETIIYSGHGEATTVGEEKLHNPYLNPHLRGGLF